MIHLMNGTDIKGMWVLWVDGSVTVELRFLGTVDLRTYMEWVSQFPEWWDELDLHSQQMWDLLDVVLQREGKSSSNHSSWILKELFVRSLRIPLSSKKSASSAVAPPTAKFTPLRRSWPLERARYGGKSGIPNSCAVIKRQKKFMRTKIRNIENT